MDQQYTYEYCFESEGREIVCHVSHGFDEITDLESISVFPHRERRALALALMAKYPADHYHDLDSSDVVCPFAVQLKKLFQNNLKVFWTRKFRITMLFYTGSFLTKTRIVSEGALLPL